MLHGNRGARYQSKKFQSPKRFCTTIGDAADCRAGTERPFCERHLVAENAGFVLPRDRMSMWIEFGIAQYGGYAIFKSLRDEVLETFGFVVNFVPGIPQDVV